MQPVLAHKPDGGLALLFVPPSLAELLLDIPRILDTDDRPEVQHRLFPDPSESDEEANEEWRRMMVPELFALIATARDVVAKDLETLERTRNHPLGGVVDIPRVHRNAWISALNAVRLAMGAEHGVTAEDMADDDVFTRDDERSLTIARIHLLGEIQGVIIHAEDPLPSDDVEDGDEPEAE